MEACDWLPEAEIPANATLAWMWPNDRPSCSASANSASNDSLFAFVLSQFTPVTPHPSEPGRRPAVQML